MTLDQLAVGDFARVVSLGDDEAAERMMEMGLVEGTGFQVVRFAPLGDPIEIKARGYHLSIRRAEAMQVEVEKE